MSTGVSVGQHVKGTIRSAAGEILPFAAAYIKGTTYGTSANNQGRYFLEVDQGENTIVFSFVGYEDLEKTVTVGEGETVTLNITMNPGTNTLSTAEVVSDTRDFAKEIMSRVRERRRTYLDAIDTYACSTYYKSSLVSNPKVFPNEELMAMPDSLLEAAGITIPTVRQTDLVETVSLTYFNAPERYFEKVLGYQDFRGGKIWDDPGRSITMGAGIEFGEERLDPVQSQARNAYNVYENIQSCDFNFYQNNIEFDALLQKPAQSPIAAAGALNYRFDYISTLYEEGKKVYQLKVTPLYTGEPLFSGTIYVQDSTFALKSVDLRINPPALKFCKTFQIIQNYEEVEPGVWLPVRREMQYSINDGGNVIQGHSRVDHSGYTVNDMLPEVFSNTEIRQYDTEAFERDSSFWAQQRPLTLKKEDLEFIQRSDSVRAWYTSDQWYHKVDSAYKIMDIWTPFIGWGYRNRTRGVELYIEGLLAQVNPFGIGGYRHRLPAQFSKEFDNNFLLETDGFVDYGFRNEDVKGKIGIGFTYVPLKFVRTKVKFGDYYNMVNDYASIEQTFSRSNYVRTKEVSLSQRMEVVNGLFAELSLEYSDQIPLSNLTFANWSESLFGDLNTPIPFERYRKAEVALRVKYRIQQKYVIRKGKKVILGSDFPEITLNYRKGVPDLFESEVDFDYIELGVSDEWELARYGSSRWKVEMGTYMNKANLRVLEYKYFRGSDRFFFSDPLRSFQLLGPTLNTPNEWLQANYIHHFEGTILGKVPLLNRMKLGLAGGGGLLSIPDSDFNHAELFAGLERVTRIKDQLFKLSAYAVTADNSLSDPTITFKFGISFYNSFLKKWDY